MAMDVYVKKHIGHKMYGAVFSATPAFAGGKLRRPCALQSMSICVTPSDLQVIQVISTVLL